ncbi:MAG: glutaredoxin family protein [Planctomycetes bacterium]|nr:glutaredoxin family protein [Planctomycetota bacterium]
MEFLSQQKIPFVEKDVTVDEKAAEELMALGSMSTPTIVIDGQMLVGFNPQRLLQLAKS